jgi:hypothetical protein
MLTGKLTAPAAKFPLNLSKIWKKKMSETANTPNKTVKDYAVAVGAIEVEGRVIFGSWRAVSAYHQAILEDLVTDVRKMLEAGDIQPVTPVVAYRMETKPGEYSYMDAKHWEYNKKPYLLNCRVHEMLLGKKINEPNMDPEVVHAFPSIIEERLKADRPDLFKD